MFKEFGVTKEGIQTHLYTLSNSKGMRVDVSDYGATVVSILTEDKNGELVDVSLGYDNVTDYENNTCYFGAIIGRNANRIAFGQCMIDGVTYQMNQNHHENNLHSGDRGFDVVVWDAQFDENEPGKIKFHYISKDMEQNLPGNFDVTVTYKLLEDNTLSIVYDAETDKTTLANMTTHIYYNLNGHDNGNIGGHELMIPASLYTPMVDEKAIPTGVNKDVTDTPFDFRSYKRIQMDVDDSTNKQIKFANGYDHNFMIDVPAGKLRTVAKAIGDLSGIVLEIESDCEAIQFYSGNGIGEHIAKGGAEYGSRQGFALEPQYVPNGINVRDWSSPLLRPGEKYHSETKLHFSVQQ
ncbi:MAG: galactose mutarotase [Lachnospiraceae bacterium]|nr:galactose mutarotase [Lachnospiraceae bacterium]